MYSLVTIPGDTSPVKLCQSVEMRVPKCVVLRGKKDFNILLYNVSF